MSGSVGQAVANAIVSAFSRFVDSSASWILGHVLALATSTTTINLGSSWFIRRETLMVTLMALLLVPLLIAGTISAVAHQDLRRLARTWLVGLPASIVATTLVIGLTTTALQLADAMTSLVTSADSLDAYHVLTDVPGLPGLPPPVATSLCIIVLLGALAVWLELVVRSAAVYVAVFFLPLALAAMVWPAAAHMARRLIEGLAALVLMKFVIVATLSLGAAAVRSGNGVDQVAAGIAVLLIAAFAPYVLFRMVPVVEAASIGHLAGLSRQPFRAAASSATRIAGVVSTGGAALGGLKRGAPAGVGASATQPMVPEAPVTYPPRDEGQQS